LSEVSEADGTPRVRAEGVTVEKAGRVIVRDVSLDVAAGEVLGVLGPSGAGKSTFFGGLVGEEALVRGRVFLGGDDVTRMPLWRRARRGLGYIPQSPSVLWDLTVEDNLRTFFQVAGRGGTRSIDDDVRAAASEVGLERRRDVKAGALSGGERRRLELVRALTTRPKVLVCDEPFAGVDPKGAAHLGELLVKLAASGVAVLVADHHVEEALRICTRATLLLDGAVALVATPEEFRKDPLVRGRYLGTWTDGR
jgi:lipopolysaccharide export system ATP-binding protein